jgi:hypothetical protein
MNTIHDFHASVESISQLWNLFHQVRNEGTFFTTLEFISPGNLQEQISHQWNLYNIIFLWNMFYWTYITGNYSWWNLFHRNLFWLTLGRLDVHYFSQEHIQNWLIHIEDVRIISFDFLVRRIMVFNLHILHF